MRKCLHRPCAMCIRNKNDMIKILFFIDNITAGGAEKVLRSLVNNMDQGKFDITVQTLDEADPKQYLAPGIRYRAINRCKTAFGRKLFHYWVRLCAELKWLYSLYIKDDYDIEVAYLECGPTKMIAGSTNKKAKKLAWVHCDLEKKGLQNSEKQQRIYAAYDRIVAVSRNVQDSFIKQFGLADKTEVLHNVVDETEILVKSSEFPVTNTAFTYAAVGRLTHQKGFDRLLDACALLKKDGAEFQLQILGTGPERENLEKQIMENGLTGTVQLLGFRENPYPYIRSADTVVCSSRYEGLSTAVTEALILGKAIVTTPCTGMAELLGDSEFGLITKDSTEGIYQGMKRMLEDSELRAHYAQKAAVRGRDFSKEKLVANTERFFESLQK